MKIKVIEVIKLEEYKVGTKMVDKTYKDKLFLAQNIKLIPYSIGQKVISEYNMDSDVEMECGSLITMNDLKYKIIEKEKNEEGLIYYVTLGENLVYSNIYKITEEINSFIDEIQLNHIQEDEMINNELNERLLHLSKDKGIEIGTLYNFSDRLEKLTKISLHDRIFCYDKIKCEIEYIKSQLDEMAISSKYSRVDVDYLIKILKIKRN